MVCPNCETPNPHANVESAKHCTECGANLFAKKYIKAEDPTAMSKRIADLEKVVNEDLPKIKTTLQQQEEENAARDKRTKRTLFGS